MFAVRFTITLMIDDSSPLMRVDIFHIKLCFELMKPETMFKTWTKTFQKFKPRIKLDEYLTWVWYKLEKANFINGPIWGQGGGVRSQSII